MRLIDADALEESFNTKPYDIVTMQDSGFSADSVFGIISEAPTVDAFPAQHGHWVQDIHYDSLFGLGQAYCTCSVCGRRKIGSIEYHKKYYLYCEKCGAKMDEVTQDE